MSHCIALEFGGDDLCVSLVGYETAWATVGMEGEPHADLFRIMDSDGNGCLSEQEMFDMWRCDVYGNVSDIYHNIN